MRLRTFVACTALFTSAGGCAVETDGSEAEAEYQEKSQNFFYNPGWIWDDPELSVCWTNPSSSNSTERLWVRRAVEGAFEADTNLQFTGWSECGSGGAAIKIAVSDEFPPEAAVGNSPGFDTGEDMRLNFFEGDAIPRPVNTPALAQCWKHSEQGLQPTTGDLGLKYWSTNRQRCIETIAVHEFLHAAGQRHEQDSPLINRQSCGERQPDDGVHVALGYWDLTSASNYCNPSYRGETILSALDVSGLIELYGSPTSDQLWHGYGNIRDLAGVTTDGFLYERTNFNISGNYRPLVGDYNGDGRDDIFWYKPGSGADKVFFGSSWGSGFWSRSVDMPNSAQATIADFNRDGYDDVVWHTPSTGQNLIWYGSGNGTFSQASTQSMPGNYDHKPYAGDFDGDGYGDIFWDGQSGAPDQMWYGESNGFATQVVYYASGSRPLVGDFDGDGQDDIYFHYPNTNAGWVGYSNNRSWLSYKSIPLQEESNTTALSTSDLNGDGVIDIIFSTSGITDLVWKFAMERGTRQVVKTSSVLAGENGDAVPVGGDFNGDGMGDIFWFSR